MILTDGNQTGPDVMPDSVPLAEAIKPVHQAGMVYDVGWRDMAWRDVVYMFDVMFVGSEVGRVIVRCASQVDPAFRS